MNSVEQMASLKQGKVRHTLFVSGFSFETNIALSGTTYLLLKMLEGISLVGNFSLSKAGIL